MIGQLRRPRALIGAAVLLTSLVGGTLAAHESHAGYTICRTDPTVTLESGTTVTMWAEMDVDPSQIVHVQYVLHVPHNLKAQSISYDQYGYLEDVQIVDDQNGNRYMTETVAETTTGADVTAYATLSTGDRTGQAKGHNNDDLVIKFKS